MRKSIKIAFCGIIAALITALMAASFIPNATFAVPAVAGLFIIAAFAEAGVMPAFGAFSVSAILSFFIAEKTSWLLYIAFFGYYPIIKPAIERIRNFVLKWAAKITLFNLAALCCYFAERFIIGNMPGGWLLAAIWVTGNIAFVLYDIAVLRIATLYYKRLHKRISDILK